ncbi:MAG: nucleoside triphosphate pyrophosphohydrolase [Bacillota bacterium]
MAELLIVGLGPGSRQQISLGAWQQLTSGLPLILRTSHHPLAAELADHGVEFTSCDDLYQQHPTFEQVYQAIWQRLQLQLQQHNRVVYAVPGHPLVAERTVRELVSRPPEQGVVIRLISSMSSLEAIYQAVDHDPSTGLLVADALDADGLDLNPAWPTIYLQLYDRLIAGELKLRLLELYPAEWPVVLVHQAGTDRVSTTRIPLWQLDHQDPDHLTSLFVPACPEAKTAGRWLEELMQVMERLRAPEGCPWDLEQDHQSLRPYLLEEAHEVLEAIDQGDMHKLADELGDLLLQVVFHAQIAKENGDFDLRTPVRLIVEKMRRRHPHVFGQVTVRSSADVLRNWQAIKAEERAGRVSSSLLQGVPKVMPGLLQAYKLQQKAATVGFDWPDVSGAWQKVKEETAEFEQALETGDPIACQDELGDLLFAIVNVARFHGIEAETALLSTINKFRRRFAYIEQQAEREGHPLTDYTLEELDRWWEEAKHKL